jgi:hypothetical protein
MAEVKNSFLGSKMNQDLDDRLVPSNEYRKGVNISVSNSEENNVGALETALGNLQLANIPNTIIGTFVSEVNDTIYLFTTTHTDSSNNQLDDFASSSDQCGIYSYNVLTGDLKTLVSGFFLNFSTTHPVHGVNLIENLLFWTDNRNQPRKINVQVADGNAAYYTSEDHISVAKYAPFKAIELYKETSAGSGVYETTMKDVVSEKLPDGSTNNPDYDANYAGDKNYLNDKFVRFSYRFKFDDGEYSIMAPFTQIAFIPKQDGSFIDKFDASDNLVESDEDDAYKSSIVKFMENKVNNIKLIIPFEYPLNELESKLKISQVEILFKESDSNAVKSIEELPISKFNTSETFYEYDYQCTKPARTLPAGQTTRVYDKVPVRALGQEVASNRVIYSNYVNKHSAPLYLDYSVNVSEKFSSSVAPTSRALEEYPEHTLKQNRNYQVGIVLSDRYGRQSGVILSENTNTLVTNTGEQFGSSTIYAPYKSLDPKTFSGDSLKILFNSTINSTKSSLTEYDRPGETGEPGLFVEANTGIVSTLSVYAIGSGYTNGTYNTTVTTPGGSSTGSGLEVTITTNGGQIVSAVISKPGTGYNVGDIIGLVGASGTGGALQVATLQQPNPLGWYSYKVVVKQTEQEYYNVYVPDIISGNITTSTASDQEENIAFISLINDNINKVPRELSEVAPDQKTFSSETILYPRVDTPPPPQNLYNKMFDVGQEGSFVGTIAPLDELTGSDQSGNSAVYQAESDPLIAKILTPYVVGKEHHNNTIFTLGVLETDPFESLIDIYWETTTSGLISDLNKAVKDSDPDAPSYIEDWDFDLNEGDASGTAVSSTNFKIKTATGATFNATVSIDEIVDGNQIDRSSDFNSTLTGNNTSGFNIETNSTFYYGPGANVNESYRFILNVTNTSVTPNISRKMELRGSLANIAPTIDSFTPPPTYIGMSQPIITFTGKNGTANASMEDQNLSWTFGNGEAEILDFEGTGVNFYLQPLYNGGVLSFDYNTSSPPNRTFSLDIVLTDAGGATDTETITIDLIQGEFSPSQFSTAFNL